MTSSPTEKPDVPSPRLADLDGLRALAILLVVSFHSWYFLQFAMPTTQDFLAFSDSLPWILGFIRRGDLGVDIFFVLSGYLLSWQLFKKRQKTGGVDFKRFYTHRFFRIYPLYVVALLLAVFDSGMTPKLLGNLLAYNIWTNASDIIIPWTWSLSVELEFYAVVPFLILLIRNGRTLGVITVGFCLLTIGWTYWVIATHPQLLSESLFELSDDDVGVFYRRLYVSMPVRMSQFTLGMAGAWIVLNYISLISNIGKVKRVLMGVFIIVGLIFPLLHNPFAALTEAYRPVVYSELLFGRVTFAMAISLMIIMLHSGTLPRLRKLLSAPILEPVARFSFSIYLFHPLFVYLGIVLFVGTDKTETVSVFQYVGVNAVAVLGSMLLGFVTWHLIEHPAIRFGRKKFG